ncbi:putative glucose transporter HXT5 [Colletotrichum fructicola]|nr:putative glucose transporter HXT5 [Colletotrichum fructicola]KAF4932973.1 putative glucose transporter HXT5 [Colletotrichum fructicola]
MVDWYTVGVALIAAMGTLLFGFDTGIATTTIAHGSWKEYMNHPSDAMTGAVVALYIIGETLGAITQSLLGDKIGRIHFMQMMCIIVTIGSTIQTAAINISMFLAGRAIAGIAVGGMVGTVPMYLSEISRPEQRGLIGGIAGAGISFGAMLANWVGYAGSYAPDGAIQWRLPLALQIPWGLIMLLGLVTFMPDSPRQLIRAGKIEAARRALSKMRSDTSPDEFVAEFDQMQAQIEFEMEREIASFGEALHLYRHRCLVTLAVQVMTSLTGVNVVQYYQTIVYKSLGMEPRTILALAGVYGTVAFVVNYIALVFFMDRWGRRKMIIGGLASIVLVLIYTAVMQRQFQETDNRVGKGFTILGIYMFVTAYYGLINSATWLYSAEVLPLALRAKVMGLACACHFIVNIGVTQAGPSAFSTIHENYYYVFVGCTAFFTVIAYFSFEETRHKTLEEISQAFGDEVTSSEDMYVARAKLDVEEKSQQIEHRA